MRRLVGLALLVSVGTVLGVAGTAQGQVQDLHVEDVTWDQLAPDETTTFNASITNEGTGDETQRFNVTIRILQDDVQLVKKEITRLNSGKTKYVEGNWTAHTGQFTVNVSLEDEEEGPVDQQDDPGDHHLEKNFSVPGPELVADKLRVQPSNPVENEDVGLAGTFSNIAEGFDVQDTFQIQFRVLDDDGTLVHDAIRDVDQIRETTTKQRLDDTWTANDSGSYTAEFEVDVNEDITEVNETNNTVERPFTVTAAQPDLAVTDVRPAQADPQANETTAIEAVIENQGNTHLARDFDTRFKINGTTFGPDVTATVGDRLEPGESLTVTSGEKWLAQKGHHDLTAIADPGSTTDDDKIQNESSEANNELTTELHVGPDLIVDGLAWSPDPAVDGFPVTFKPRILNQGTAAVTVNTTVFLEIPGDNEEFSQEIGPLEPGNSTQIDVGSWEPPENDNVYEINVGADVDDEADEIDEDNNRITRDIDPVPARPDIVTTGLELDPEEPQPGDDTTIDATIDNQGSAPVEKNFEVQFLLDGEQIGDKRTIEASEIDPYEASEDPITVTSDSFSPDLDEHEITVRADPQNNVEEVLWPNNNRSTSLVVGPDARVQDISWTPVDPEAGDQVTFDVTLENVGTGSISELPARVHVDGSPIGNATTESLSSGENATVTVTWEATRGDHTVRAVADPAKAVDEAREGNNEREESFSTTASPDLQATSLGFPDDPQAGDQVLFTAQVKNTGTADVKGSFDVQFTVDGAEVGIASIDGLSVGQSQSVKSDSWTAEAGTHTVEVTVDPDGDGLVTEDDETNNVRTNTLVVESAPDQSQTENQTGEANLVVSGITAPEDIAPGDEVSFLATIENTGGSQAPASDVQFRIDDEPLGQRSIDSLDPGQSASVTSDDWTAIEGEHTLAVVADTSQSVSEADEEDNEQLQNIAVGQVDDETNETGEPQIELTFDLPETVQDGDTVPLDVVVANNGDAPASDVTVEVFVDGTRLGQVPASEIAAGSQVTLAGPDWNATEGEHTLTARTSGAQTETTVQVSPADEAEGVPGPGLALLATALSAAALVARRR